MGVYSVMNYGKVHFWKGTYADLLTWGAVFTLRDVIVPIDRPGEVYFGDGVNTFSGLKPIGSGTVQRPIATALNATAAATSAALLVAIKKGLITSTSAAGVTLTMPIATALATAFGGVSGVSLQFVVDNSAGASTVTVAVSSGVTVATAVITGADTLTVASGKVGIFRLYFTSATAVLLSRVQ